MKFGVSLFPTDTSARPDVVAREAENRGFHAFWVSEHSHMPVSTRFPMADTVPREYSSMLDPFVALSLAAGATTRILLGTAIVILPQHDPINCAKAVATLDLVSGGRVLFGIGAGWNEPELRNHRTEPSTRFRLMRERVEAMKALWTNEVAGYDGEFVRIEPSWQWPKPVQKPHPPIFVAGASPNVIRRVAIYGDGWLPVVVPQASDITPGRMTPLAELRDMVPRMRELAAEKGRPAPRVVVSGYFDAEAHAVYETLGVESLTFRLPSADFDTVRQAMDAAQAQLKEAGISLT
ncbi:MAG: LLM class F420-dependent oxidoreductase [Pseudomonadales bacterium]